MERILFYAFGALAVLGSLWMVTRRSPLSSALSLVVVFVALAAMYALLDARLLFVVQVWVYAGAVMVLVLFVIMLLNLREEESRAAAASWGKFVLCGALAVALATKAFGVLAGVLAVPPPVSKDWGGVASVAEILFTRYLVPFQIVGVLLLAVVVAVVALAKRAR
ncbi:MAG TPA: NADH-quinone oxidoreductase subunit J [Candidatus Krumholzibacteria bacterium]|nr:NADH-quinone oxidoreductase subunit J [Candidatus Krumholzibacteria bacterium]